MDPELNQNMKVCSAGRDSQDGEQTPRHQWGRQELLAELQSGHGGPGSCGEDPQELESEAGRQVAVICDVITQVFLPLNDLFFQIILGLEDDCC